ncbi:MAG: ubiquitin-activating E1 FCCH domain-containing protein [Caulobacter sp.]|nr:ubiquitin-activating E1 FCCH domain-containing protein [Caulobacter sp.]
MSVARFLRRFRHESGAVAIWFAVMALPLAVLSFGLIDVNRASVEKRHLQDALDAATLLAARSTAATDKQIQAIGAEALAAQLNGRKNADLSSVVFTIVGSKVTGTASASVTPVIANLWLQGDMSVGARAEVIRASTNLEVALVLDITGSMSGSKIRDLKDAAKDLIDMVVADVQSPYYSKAAIVPYSIGVNLGGYAAAARGPVRGGTITDASWSEGSAKSINGVTKGNPPTIKVNNHGFSDGDVVWVTGVSGSWSINDRAYTVANRTANTLQLLGHPGNKFNSYRSGGKIQKCKVSDCSIVITASNHGLPNGGQVYIDGVKGMTEINDRTFTVGDRTTNSFSLSGVNGADYDAYRSGGTASCTELGCLYYEFTNARGDKRVFEISDCVTERTGLGAYIDASPNGSPVGLNYPSPSNPCPSATITPLTSDRSALKSRIDSFSAAGSTAGQIGVAWGWYMVSPNFAYLWPSASQPAAYGTKELVKAVVIMTDGDFNTPYCNGVVARDAANGSSSDKINCNATNGDPVSQALALCTNMKAKGVVVYTVGFDVRSGSSAETLMKGCATSAAHVYLPSGGGALKDAFAAIGRDIMKLRLSK